MPPACPAAPCIPFCAGSIAKGCSRRPGSGRLPPNVRALPRRYYQITSAGEAMLAEAVERYRVLDQAVARSPRRLKPSRA